MRVSEMSDEELADDLDAIIFPDSEQIFNNLVREASKRLRDRVELGTKKKGK